MVPVIKRVVVGVDDRGMRVGESHPKARLTDHEVALLLAMRAEGSSYNALATIFEVPKHTVAAICKGRRRVSIATQFRVVCMPG